MTLLIHCLYGCQKVCKALGLRRFFPSALAAILALTSLPRGLAANSSQATDHSQHEQVGRVNFPTHCAPSVQPTMEDGLALLHSFQYLEAEKAFTDASRLDPQCALADWGKAMALYQQLWDFPNAATLRFGWQDIRRAQQLGIKDSRILGYIQAAVAFYQPPRMKPIARVQAYSSAMEKLYREHPDDNEAGELYALSLISLAQMGVEDLPNRKKAIAILNPLFAKYPDNPGAAHYLIHACDVPGLASEGLAAARVYAKIAPDSAHALHMPSHIFRRLGLWQEVIDSNIASAAAAAKATREDRGDADYQFHAMDFLNYAYLQSGQEAKAQSVVTELKDVPRASRADIIDAQNRFAARNAVELHNWKEAATLEIPKERLALQDYTYWTRAIGAARSGDLQSAHADMQKLIEIARSLKAEEARQNGSGDMLPPGMPPAGMAIEPREAEAWVAYAEGKSDKAIDLLRSAAEREEAHDDEPFATPAREMLADLLMELKRPSEALAAYKDVLKKFPDRFNALDGAARAADSLGDRHTAANFYNKLISICPPDADRPELQAARQYIARQPADDHPQPIRPIS